MELQLEHAQAMAQDSPNIFLKAAINVASVDFFTVLNRFDTVTLSKRLEEKPELYFQMMNSYCNLMKANLEQQKLEFKQEQAEARQRDRERKLRARKPILITGQILDQFTRALSGSRRREEAGASPAPNPPSHPSTANTGDSEILEFSVPSAEETELHIAVPELETPNDHDDTWHEWREEPSEDLVCSPS
jgi:hypothetical protein